MGKAEVRICAAKTRVKRLDLKACRFWRLHPCARGSIYSLGGIPMGNTFKTTFLLTALTLLLLFIGRIFGGANGMLIALLFAAVMNFISYFYSDKIALAVYRA